jgi:hypothetical protein
LAHVIEQLDLHLPQVDAAGRTAIDQARQELLAE